MGKVAAQVKAFPLRFLSDARQRANQNRAVAVQLTSCYMKAANKPLYLGEGVVRQKTPQRRPYSKGVQTE
jgi:hypothetical protein